MESHQNSSFSYAGQILFAYQEQSAVIVTVTTYFGDHLLESNSTKGLRAREAPHGPIYVVNKPCYYS